MRSGMFTTLTFWLAGGSLALAQTPRPVLVGVGYDDLPEAKAPIMRSSYNLAPNDANSVAPASSNSAMPASRYGVTIADPTAPTAPGADPKAPAAPMPPAPADAPGVVPVYPTYPAGAVYNGAVVAPPTVAQTPVGKPPAQSLAAPALFGSVDYLLFAIRRGPTVPIAQTIPDSLAKSTAPLPAGAASTLFGDDGIRFGAFSGGRVALGAYLNDAHTFGVDGSFFQFGERSDDFHVESAGSPVIGRYFSDVANTTHPETILKFSMPDGSESGSIDVHAPLQFYGADANLRFQGNAIFSQRFDWLVGARYLDLREAVYIHDRTTFTTVPNTYLDGDDNFRTTNQFYGAQVGGESHFRYGCWNLDVSNKFGFGGVDQQAYIDGQTTQVINGVVAKTVVGNVLTAPTNVGHYDRTKAAFVYELLMKLGYQFSPNAAGYVGYDLMTITSVMRPGNAMDAGVNATLNPFIVNTDPKSTQLRPAYHAQGTDFWATGLTVGLNFTY